MEVKMSKCCGCRPRRNSLGWMAFWGLVLFLVFSSNTDKQPDLINDSNQLAEVSDKPMSVSCTPSMEQDKAMQRLLTEMEEEGRRLPKIWNDISCRPSGLPWCVYLNKEKKHVLEILSSYDLGVVLHQVRDDGSGCAFVVRRFADCHFDHRWNSFVCSI